MLNQSISLIACTSALLFSCTSSPSALVLDSPEGSNQITFGLSPEGAPFYFVGHGDKTAIDTSYMSFDFEGQPALRQGLEMVNTRTRTFDEVWEMPWGEQRLVKNHYNELIVELQETAAPQRRLNVYLRAYDDGVAFRYEFLAQPGIDSLIILEENTEFQMTGDHKAWWIPADWDSYEHLYQTSKVSEIDAFEAEKKNALSFTTVRDNAVHTPVTFRTKDGLHLSIHEAALVDYASTTLKIDTTNLRFTSQLVGSERLGYKVKRALPFNTPWRTIQIADRAGDLIESKLIVNLNEPNKLGDISDWFQPMKYMGIWWEMHIDKGTWDYGLTQDETTGKWVDTGKAHGRHSATTENAKKYIDFAAKSGIKGLLIEGWNTGWERWFGVPDREGIFDFVTPYPDYDIQEVVSYAQEKGVEIIMHHETSAAPRTYEQQMDTAYQLMQSLGIHSVKSGYVGPIIPEGEHHHGQWMVNHYNNAAIKAARYQIAVNAHEPIKATGLRRTYPNIISREGLRGQEFNAWGSDGGNPPEHLSIVAFTRMLSGPIDFTPGVFDLDLPTKKDNQINTTLAHQLALYVVVYSPIQMACDLPENYEGHPAFQFIREVGVDWEQTNVLDGEIGDYVVIAREERETGSWFVGGITDENERTYTLKFDFLPEGKSYEAVIYRDAQDSHYKDNPEAYLIENSVVNSTKSLTINMKAGGGFAVSLMVQ